MILLPWQRSSGVTTHTFTVPLVPLGGMWNLKVSLERSNTGDLKGNIHITCTDVQYHLYQYIHAYNTFILHTFIHATKLKHTESHSLEIQSRSPWIWILVTDSRFLPFSNTLFLPWKETLLGSRERISGSYRTQKLGSLKTSQTKTWKKHYNLAQYIVKVIEHFVPKWKYFKEHFTCPLVLLKTRPKSSAFSMTLTL